MALANTDTRAIAYWEDKGFPHSVAVMQAQWQRRQAIIRMHRQGMSTSAIGIAMHISVGRVFEILHVDEIKRRRPPVIDYLNGWGNWSKLRKGRNTMQIIAQLADRQYEKRDWLWL